MPGKTLFFPGFSFILHIAQKIVCSFLYFHKKLELKISKKNVE